MWNGDDRDCDHGRAKNDRGGHGLPELSALIPAQALTPVEVLNGFQFLISIIPVSKYYKIRRLLTIWSRSSSFISQLGKRYKKKKTKTNNDYYCKLLDENKYYLRKTRLYLISNQMLGLNCIMSVVKIH